MGLFQYDPSNPYATQSPQGVAEVLTTNTMQEPPISDYHAPVEQPKTEEQPKVEEPLKVEQYQNTSTPIITKSIAPITYTNYSSYPTSTVTYTQAPQYVYAEQPKE